MFDLINGIPLHPLVVHAIVVLLPLATVGTLVIAVRPTWRLSYGPLVVAAAAIATVLCPVATSSGEALQKRLGNQVEHAALGNQLVFFAIPLVLLSAALVYLEWRRGREGAASLPHLLTTAVTVLAVVAALASAVQVYRVGDSGARAAWGNVPAPRAGVGD